MYSPYISHLPYNAKADIGSLDHAHIITTITCKTMFSLISPLYQRYNLALRPRCWSIQYIGNVAVYI